jgi:calreticulin
VLAAGWDKRWQKSSWKESDGSAGKFTLTAGKWYGDEEADKGIQTGPDSKYFALYSELKKAYTNEGKELIVQVSARGGIATATGCPAL